MVIELSVAGLLYGCGFISCAAAMGVGFVMGRMTQGETTDFGTAISFDSRSEKYPETEEEVYDDNFYERATHYPEDGGHPFPTDAQLAEINRHSNER